VYSSQKVEQVQPNQATKQILVQHRISMSVPDIGTESLLADDRSSNVATRMITTRGPE
jgi:hypothetical protein